MTFDAAAWFVADISLRALAAALAVALILRLLRVRAAAVLHSAWTAVLLAMLFMPVLTSILPALPVPLPAAAGGLLGTASKTEESLPASAVHSTPPLNHTTARSARVSDTVRLDRRLVSATPAGHAGPWLPPALLGVYATGVLLFAGRILYGWSIASAMIRRARRGGPIRVDIAAPVYQSADVTVPMTVGAIRPVIVLPLAWKSWDSDTLSAIIAHEIAHVRRHDASINFAAHVNRAIFWFHPLAWWLARTLALTAEHACDEAAARAIAAPRRYAQILVEMADIVRQNRGRRAWQAAGVNGAGLLDSRIDRLLGGDAFAGASRGKKIAAGIGCVLQKGHGCRKTAARRGEGPRGRSPEDSRSARTATRLLGRSDDRPSRAGDRRAPRR